MSKEFLTGFLSKTLNLDNDRLSEILFKKADGGTFTEELNENALDELLKLDEERVGKIKGSVSTKEAFNNGHKAGFSEALTKREKEIAEAFGVEESLKGLDQIKAIVSKAAKPALGDDAVKIHPLYIQLEKRLGESQADFEKRLADKDNEWQGKIKKGETVQKVRAIGKQAFLGLNPVLATEKTVAENQISDFLDKLTSDHDWEEVDSDFIPVKEGKRIERHGHPLKVADLVKDLASTRFEFQKQSPKGNAGNENGSGGQGNGFRMPATATDYNSMIMDPNIPDAEKLKIAKHWREQGKQTA